jgi:hypothetical protein
MWIYKTHNCSMNLTKIFREIWGLQMEFYLYHELMYGVHLADCHEIYSSSTTLWSASVPKVMKTRQTV